MSAHSRSWRKRGFRVKTDRDADYLKDAGADVDENTRIVRFPRKLVEESLTAAPKKFTLGARRPGWDLGMNEGELFITYRR